MLLKADVLKEFYLAEVKKEWFFASDLFPDFLAVVSEETKKQNELYIQSIFDDFQKQVMCYPRIPVGRKKWRKKMLELINLVLFRENVIGIHQALNHEELDAFQKELKEFLRHVRSFAPELNLEDIGQALRNYIVYAMFKVIHRKNSGFSLAGFGYSMLYPFTDNYIDSRIVTAKEKSEYNKIIREMLEGREVHPKTKHQKKTCGLLQAIASEFPYNAGSPAAGLLLMMLEAQEESIRQQNKDIPLSEEERLNISVYKGGISVLIDRFFVPKELNEEETLLYLGLGYFLQLADDLQDIKTDSGQGYQTLLTLDLNPKQEEKVVNKLLHFVHNTLGVFTAENDIFKKFVLANCFQLIHTSVIGSREFFSEEYIQKIEEFLPVHFPFYEEITKRFFVSSDSKMHQKYLKILDEVIFD